MDDARGFERNGSFSIETEAVMPERDLVESAGGFSALLSLGESVEVDVWADLDLKRDLKVKARLLEVEPLDWSMEVVSELVLVIFDSILRYLTGDKWS